ncbi:alpha-2-macroglobulin [Marinagarivorans algicola]|uniref:alpha-2-macroglobulin n=1 Tax=Marinagarivorans algicola TaxID=1513270 RepID=UPI0037365F99
MPTPSLMQQLFGSLSWQPPAWLCRFGQACKAHFWRYSIYLLTLSALVAGAYWGYNAYQNRPQPLGYQAVASIPKADTYIEGTQGDPSSAYVTPAPLVVDFTVDESTLPQKTARNTQHYSRQLEASQAIQKAGVAKLDLQGKTLTAEQAANITLTPNVAGQWQWQSQNRLVFTPKQSWPAEQTYTVRFTHNDDIAPPSRFFSRHIILSKPQASFTTAPLSVTITDTQFYQDLTPQTPAPGNPVATHKRPPAWQVLGTLHFSHPVDIDSLKKALTLKIATGQSEATWRDYPYTLSHGPHQRSVYIRSGDITLAEQESRMTITLAAGVQALRTGKTVKGVSRSVVIPSAGDYFKLTHSDTQIINNDTGEPDQILTLEFSDAVSVQDVMNSVELHLLPKQNPANKRAWRSAAEVSAEVLANSALPLTLTPIASEHSTAKVHSFKYDTKQQRRLYLHINKGLTSVNSFTINNNQDALLQSPAYPRTVSIMGQGALLSHSGEHKIPLVSRGIHAINMQLHKVLPSQINHLISQTHGDISSPEFHGYNFNADNIGTYSEHKMTISHSHPRTANYASYDLSRHLKDDSALGLFLVKAQAWNPTSNQPIYGVEDKRLILITDLGLLVKNNSDQSQDVFVQSIKTGLPVAGATVKLLGKNGLAIMQATTSATGHAHFASAQNYTRGKAPVAYVVTQNRGDGSHNNNNIIDTAFIPYRHYSRQLNYSRFDVGGVRKQYGNQNPLSAFVFTDRGIYRPGDTVNIAAIVKRQNFTTPTAIPLEIDIRDPKGNSVLTRRIQLPKYGFLELPFNTQATSNTGRYSAFVYLMSNNGSRRYRSEQLGVADFQVEEFQPDRLKITTHFALADKAANTTASKPAKITTKGWITDSQLLAHMQLNNLFGAPAQNRRATAKLTLNPIRFYFKQYSEYHFTDPQLNNQAQAKTLTTDLPTATTDAQGQANFTIDLSAYSAGTYNINLHTQGYEADGGRSVQANINQWVSPLKALVGHKSASNLSYLKRGSEHTIEFINIDSQLNTTARNALNLALIEERYVSTLVKQRNGTYSYQSVKKRITVNKQAVNIGEQGYSHTLNTDNAGDFVLELKEGNTIISRAHYSVAGQGNISGKLEKNAELNIKLNKTDYAPGDTIELSITAPYTGAGLITIESDHVHAHQWFTSQSTSSIQHITLPYNIEGNAYINVAFVRAIDSEEVFISPLSYSAVPFNIDRSARQVTVNLKAPTKIKPGQTLQVEYSTATPSRIAIFAVDEGILQVAKYNTPNPLAHFMKKRALQVSTQQILDLILPEFNLLKQHAGIGGGAAAMQKALANNLNPFSRKTDKPAVFWAGIKEANSQTQSASFTLPDTFAGSLRIMAVAVNDQALGTATTNTLVRGPFVLSPNALTVAAPGDEFDVALGIANGIEGSGDGARITVTLSTSEHLKLIGANANADSQQEHIIAEGGEGKAVFKVRATHAIGAAQLRFSASLTDASGATHTSTRSASLSVRPATPFSSTLSTGITGSSTLNKAQQLPVPRQLLPALANNKITASSAPIALTDGLLGYLHYYPHMCTEQIVSRVFPLLGFFDHPQLDDAKSREAKYQKLLQALSARQHNNGSFSHWPSHYNLTTRPPLDSAHDYPTLYALHFLTDAKALGLSVPSALLTRGYDYLRQLARATINTHTDDSRILEQAHLQAYALYLLSRSGQVTTNHLVNLQEVLTQHKAARKQNKQHFNWQNDITAVYMAATYQLLKQNKEATKLIKHYKLSDSSTFNNRQNSSGYHSPLALNAQYIYIATRHFNADTLGITEQDMQQFLTPLWSNQYNTLSASFATLALSAYSKAQQAKGIDQTIHLTQIISNATTGASDNTTLQPLTLNTQGFPYAHFDANATSLTLKAQAPVFYALQQNGYNTVPPAKAAANNIEITREYQNKQGQSITQAKQGEEISVVLRARSLTGQAIANTAIIDLLPGGFEILRESLEGYRNGNNPYWQPEYIDIREDRLVFYGTVTPQITEIRYQAKVTARGRFIVPAATAQSMYDLTTYAHTAAGQFEVLDH